MTAPDEMIGETALRFIASSGGWIAEREGFCAGGATRRAAVQNVDLMIARARDERAICEHEWSMDLEAMVIGTPSAIEVASWDP